MPYIKKELREALDPDIVRLINKVKEEVPEGERDGALNYVISRVVAATMKPDEGWRYVSLARAAEVFTAAGGEFRRRMLDPYETQSILGNGDIPEYKGYPKD
jgi:hypothetical protein